MLYTRILTFYVTCLLAFTSLGSAEAAEQAALEEGMVNPGYHEQPAWFKQSFLDLRDDVSEATDSRKRVVLYFYQDGCPYCAKLLSDNLAQKPIADKMRKHFDVIAINMWGDREVTGLDGSGMKEKDFAAKHKVMFTPTLLFLTEQGKLALRMNGYYAPEKFIAALDYVSQKQESKLGFGEYYQKLKPASASGKLHDEPFFLKPPYDFSKLLSSGKPLLVLFEQKQCFVCDELHADIFKRKETLEQVKRFNVVRLDLQATTALIAPNGKHITAKSWARKLDIKYVPSMVFFDGSADEVIRIEAYLKSFHTQSIMDYVASGAYKTQPSFQRFIAERAEKLEAQGIHVDLMK